MNRLAANRRCGAILALLPAALLLAPRAARAVDTAFWQPYEVDPATHVLLHFDAPDGRRAEGTAEAPPGELLGDAAQDPQGKFGGAIRVGGHGALKLVPTAIFPGRFLAVEAWIWLDRLPEKEAYLVCRPAVVDRDPKYDPEKDVTKGFALTVDARGALHLETTNCYYGRKARTSSPEGAVPVGRWVHVAGVCAGFPVSSRRLFVDGREVQARALAWGEGLMVGDDEERRPGPIYVGADPQLASGLSGRIDEVRIHTRVVRFWERDDAWTAQVPPRPVVDDSPYFVHRPTVYLPLDGDARDAASRVKDLKIHTTGSPAAGVHGQGWAGNVTLSAPKLLDLREGSVEFWMQPKGVNNLADNNRTFFSGPFTLYFLNDSGGVGRKPLTLYFHAPAGIHFVTDGTQTEIYPGAWYHLVATWKDKTVALYINGRLAQKTSDQALADSDAPSDCDRVQFLPGGAIGIVDELRLYDRALLPEEVGNAFWRYRDAARLVSGVEEKRLDVRARHFPSSRTIEYQCTPNGAIPAGAKLRLTLADASSRVLLREEHPFTTEERSLKTPELPNGAYTLTAEMVEMDGQTHRGDTFSLARYHFPWENNRLGITDEVFPPFTPVHAQGTTVSVVGRTYTMNGFGLWDQVTSLGRDLLADPMRLRWLGPDGEGTWSATPPRLVGERPNAAVYEAQALADAVEVRARSTIEVDGCMKVEMQLLPGPRPREIRKLWIEIPLRAGEVPLMHAIGDGLRHNHSGRTPEGQGPVWDGSKAARSGPWRNGFTPYVWLGAEQRGLAWFGENDKGWVTEKQHSTTPTHELLRDGQRVVLRVYLVNRPVTLDGPRQLVFGLQASPTKPLPADWRARLPDMPGGLAVVPFGGLECASQAPLGDDWQVVDKVLEARAGRPFDQAWLTDYVRRHHPPLVHGTWDWANSVEHFAGRAKDAGLQRPVTVYQEEMAASPSRPEYVVFQDEWNADPWARSRAEMDPADLGRGQWKLAHPAWITFGPSYRDFGCWIAQQWLQRGVSLYWDNDYLHLSTNVRTTDAYLCEDGQVQPVLGIWNQREYQKRVWHLLQQYRPRRPEPLEFVLHMTNTLVLPVHTWGTVDLDHELGRDTPFPMDWLRTETIGRQVGNLPLSLYAVAGKSNRVLEKLAATMPKVQSDALRDRVEWGMRVVHEIQHRGPLDKLLAEFGYGTDRAAVHNYWDESPVLGVSRPDVVAWLALSDRARNELLAVLASWSPDDVTVEVVPDAKILAMPAERMRAVDAESGRPVPPTAPGRLSVKLAGPYGVAVLRWRAGSPVVKERGAAP